MLIIALYLRIPKNCICVFRVLQEIRNSGAVGYKYITVDEDEAANVIYANNVLIHLSNEQIPKGAAVSVTTEIVNSI